MSESTDLITPDADELALAQQATAGIDTDDLIVPLLKLAQGLTAEVSEGNARAGQFVNSLTGEAFDGPVEVVLVTHQKGRFFSPEGSSDAYVAVDTPVAPDNWPPEYAGQHFADLPDAEEQFAAAANAGDIEWGDGPPIRTTYNYLGFAVEDPDLPLRLSLQRTSRQTARKLNTLLKAASAPWAHTYLIDAEAKDNAKGKFYVYTVRRGRPVTPDEHDRALSLARALQTAEVEYHGDEDAAPAAKPKSKAKTADDPDAIGVS